MNCKLTVFFLFPFLVLAGAILAQTPEVQPAVVDYADSISQVVPLPGKVRETSGLIRYEDGIWTFNDSGGKAEIYKIDPGHGNIIRTVTLEGAVNRDWEDIAQDSGHIYVGDFGNNYGNRRDLRVFMIPKKSIPDGPAVSAPYSTIFFSYSDQKSYEKKNRNNDFDCESLVSYGDHLLLFTKNWVSGRTRMYSLPKTMGIHTLEPLAEFEAEGLVTAADYCMKSNMLVLLGYAQGIPFLYIFDAFDGKSLDPATATRVNITTMANVQSEGICFLDDGRLAISAEATPFGKQSLYILDLRELMPGHTSKNENDRP